MNIILKKKKKQGAEGRQTLEPEKVHSTGELVIMVKFDDCGLLCLEPLAFWMWLGR